MSSSEWKKRFQISPHRHSHGRLCSEPWSKRVTLILRVQELQDLTGKFAHSVTVETGMSCLIVKCFEHRFRVQPTAVLSRLKGKLSKEMIAWQPTYVLQLPSQEPTVMLYHLGRGRIETNIYRNALVSLLQHLPLQQSLRRSQNHLLIWSYQIQEKEKSCQPSRDLLL